jgi:hypothetical protein
MSPQSGVNRMVIGNIVRRKTLFDDGFDNKEGPNASGLDPIFVNGLNLISSVRAEVIQVFEEASSKKNILKGR